MQQLSVRPPLSYDESWHSVWVQANRTFADPLLDEVRRKKRPRVYVYNISQPFSDADLHTPSAHGTTVGSPFHLQKGYASYDDSGSVLAATLHSRLFHSRMYQTTDPSEADLFVVPILTAPKREHVFDQHCRQVAAALGSLESSLEHLTVQSASRHLVAFSEENVAECATNCNCSGWFWRPQGLLAHAIRIPYSEHVPPSHRSSAYSRQRRVLFAKQTMAARTDPCPALTPELVPPLTVPLNPTAPWRAQGAAAEPPRLNSSHFYMYVPPLRNADEQRAMRAVLHANQVRMGGGRSGDV